NMPRESLACTKTTCDLGLDLSKPALPEETLHLQEYHKPTMDFKNILCNSLVFHRNEQDWTFECACGGRYKPDQSFRRHVKQCGDIQQEVEVAYAGEKKVTTKSYEIVPKTYSASGDNSQRNESSAMNHILLLQLHNEIVRTRQEAARSAQLQLDVLTKILSQLQAQNAM
ncbi:hypothetical protein BGX27_004733, partial [Mortierella sp. AM989]